LENSKSAIIILASLIYRIFLFTGLRSRIKNESYAAVKNMVSPAIFGNGETTVTMETILCSRILQTFSIKYLIYTRECLKLIDEVIKIIN
jgi:hypothetical protein